MRKLVWCLVLAACGGNDDSGGGGGGDGGGGSDGSGSGQVPANSGFVAITSIDAVSGTTPIQNGSVSASFAMAQTTYTCAQNIVGPCTVYVCPTTTPPAPTYASAGTVSVTGLAQPVSLTPQANKMYTAFTSQATLFSGGETITITGAGADVPAFSIGITGPGRATITQPAKPSGTFTINRAQDFTVRWSGGGAGKVFVYVSGPSGSGASLNCGFDASAGMGSVPAAALGMLPAGSGAFSSASLAVKSIDTGGWRIYGQAFFDSVWAADTSIAASSATLQ
jgi:hypothetical protein